MRDPAHIAVIAASVGVVMVSTAVLCLLQSEWQPKWRRIGKWRRAACCAWFVAVSAYTVGMVAALATLW